MTVQLFRQTGWMVVRQIRNLMREPIWIAMMVIQPMLWLLLYGQLFKHVGAQGHQTKGSYEAFLTPGVVAMNAFFGGMWSGMAMINDLDRHVIDRFLAAPTVRVSIVLSQVVRAAITAILQALVLLLVALAIGVHLKSGLAGWLTVFAGAALLCAVFAGLSQGLALLMRREASMIAAANFVGMPLMFLSAILVTTTLMPGWIRSIARYNPVNWGTQAMRNAVYYGNNWGPTGIYLALLVGVTAVTALFATWCFRAYQRSI
jgi:ABC-2 type transport system permease protein